MTKNDFIDHIAGMLGLDAADIDLEIGTSGMVITVTCVTDEDDVFDEGALIDDDDEDAEDDVAGGAVAER